MLWDNASKLAEGCGFAETCRFAETTPVERSNHTMEYTRVGFNIKYFWCFLEKLKAHMERRHGLHVSRGLVGSVEGEMAKKTAGQPAGPQ